MRSIRDLSDLDWEPPEELWPTAVRGDPEPLAGESIHSILERYERDLELSKEVRRAGKTAMRAAIAAEGVASLPAAVGRIETVLQDLTRSRAVAPVAPPGAEVDRRVIRLIGAMNGLDALGALLRRDRRGEEGCDRARLDPRSVGEGLALVQTRIAALLGELGVARLSARGVPFDPALHEAVGYVAASEPEGTVVDEDLAGYVRAGRVLRFARVVVARGAAPQDQVTGPERSFLEEDAPEAPPATGPPTPSGPSTPSRLPSLGGEPSILKRLWARILGRRPAISAADEQGETRIS